MSHRVLLGVSSLSAHGGTPSGPGFADSDRPKLPTGSESRRLGPPTCGDVGELSVVYKRRDYETLRRIVSPYANIPSISSFTCATNAATDMLPRSPALRLRGATPWASTSFSPTTSM